MSKEKEIRIEHKKSRIQHKRLEQNGIIRITKQEISKNKYNVALLAKTNKIIKLASKNIEFFLKRERRKCKEER